VGGCKHLDLRRLLRLDLLGRLLGSVLAELRDLALRLLGERRRVRRRVLFGGLRLGVHLVLEVAVVHCLSELAEVLEAAEVADGRLLLVAFLVGGGDALLRYLVWVRYGRFSDRVAYLDCRGGGARPGRVVVVDLGVDLKGLRAAVDRDGDL
jgi:hypothetical protein